MNSIVPDYEAISLRGSGVFGYVIEAYDRTNDIKVAIKRSNKTGRKISREYEIVSKLKECPYIVKLLDIFYSEGKNGKIIQNLVFEFINGSLEGYIKEFKENKKNIPIEKIKNIVRQLIEGLAFCHSQSIVHRDLKPENVLLTEDSIVKICDFGSSKIIKKGTVSTPYIVSRYYRAPELILGKVDYDEKIDIFSAGCIISELFLLAPLFKGEEEALQLFEYMAILGKPKENYFKEFKLDKTYIDFFEKLPKISTPKFQDIINENKFYDEEDIDQASDLLLKMLSWDPKERISAKDALNHPFLKK